MVICKINISSFESVVGEEFWEELEDKNWLKKERYNLGIKTPGIEKVFSFEEIISIELWNQLEEIKTVKRSRSFIERYIECDNFECEGAGCFSYLCYLKNYQECPEYKKMIRLR